VASTAFLAAPYRANIELSFSHSGAGKVSPHVKMPYRIDCTDGTPTNRGASIATNATPTTAETSLTLRDIIRCPEFTLRI